MRKTLNFVLAIFFISNFPILIDSHAKDFLKEIERSGGTTEQKEQRDFDMGEERIGDAQSTVDLSDRYKGVNGVELAPRNIIEQPGDDLEQVGEPETVIETDQNNTPGYWGINTRVPTMIEESKPVSNEVTEKVSEMERVNNRVE